jgi:hypothetical protein
MVAGGAIATARLNTHRSLRQKGLYVSVIGTLYKIKSNWSGIYGKNFVGYREYDNFTISDMDRSFR